MRKTHLLSGLYLTGLLSGCNSAEGLIPPADIGDTSMPAYEQTSSDRIRSAPVQPVYAQQQSYDGAAQGYAESSPDYSHSAQNSLEAQAAALNSGAARSPAASAPLDGDGWSGDQPQPEPQYTERRQTPPAAPASDDQDFDQPLPPATRQANSQPAPSAQPQQVASLTPASPSGQSIRFLPIIGAPVEKVTPLSHQLGADARARGITIRGSEDNASDYILKGYLSAFADGGKINVVYVWDVLDASGARLHRIQGQERVAGESADPWAAVPSSVMQRIATETIDQYIDWRQARAG
ncbi:hypothetical protein [Rhizobium halophytocola]|uniref:Lipoprotein n=1 Tax=Rhizobium halophytocola TaxID=735519 RepID=A0ABS4E3T9_9HYPH|nr:hypothetical protein [Rhizobium halophytocola]MBP1852615.1 hypothetical protein [Rhizobium halophytocola]